MEKLKKNIIDQKIIDKDFVEKFYDTLYETNKMIDYKEVKHWIGFKKKQTVIDILKNDKYKFIEGEEYTITYYKPETGRPGFEIKLSIETLKNLCLMSASEQGQKFRRYYIEMEKLFKKYVATEIQNKLTNPIPQLNKYDFDVNKYHRKEVLYLLKVKDDIYKFGITINIAKRLNEHQRGITYEFVYKVWDCINRSISKLIEDDIKRYNRINKLNFKYGVNTEIIKTSDIDSIIKIYDTYVENRTNEYKKTFNNRELEQKIDILDKMIEFQKLQNEKLNKQLGIIKNTKCKDNFKINLNLDSDINNIKMDNILNKEDIQIKINKNDNINKETQEQLNDMEKNLQFCKKCKTDKELKDFGFNEIENEYFKQCNRCRQMGAIYDKNQRERDKLKLQLSTQEKKEIGNEKDRNYYRENKRKIIEHKKIYRNERINNNQDPTKRFCKKCNTFKPLDKYPINPKTKLNYKQCDDCRNKANFIKLQH